MSSLRIATIGILLIGILIFSRDKILVMAQLSCITGGTQTFSDGLVTAYTNEGVIRINSSGTCIIDRQTEFAPFKIPDYQTLKSKYYTQSKLGPTIKKAPNAGLVEPFTQDGIYNFTSDVPVSTALDPLSVGTQIFFVDQNLNINIDLIYHTNDAAGGLVFVVGGDVNIAPTVKQIDAVIISSGTIYTARSSTSLPCNTSDVLTTNPLVINGNLVSLNGDKAIKLCRKLADNKIPAEQFNTQFKYLATLKELFSDTYEKWSEVDISIPIPTPGPIESAPPTASGLVNRVFITSQTFNGALGGITGADNQCQTLANTAGVGGSGTEWKAWISDSTQSPASRFTLDKSKPFKLLNGLPLANNWNDLIDGVIANPINVTEWSQQDISSSYPILTNTNHLGNQFGPTSHCSNWASTLGAFGSGYLDTVISTWTGGGLANPYRPPTNPCGNPGKLYCFDQKANPLPEPPTSQIVNRVFVTNSTFTPGTAGFNSLAAADNQCQVAATQAALGGSWKAWLSDSTNSPSTRFNTSSDYRRGGA